MKRLPRRTKLPRKMWGRWTHSSPPSTVEVVLVIRIGKAHYTLENVQGLNVQLRLSNIFLRMSSRASRGKFMMAVQMGESASLLGATRVPGQMCGGMAVVARVRRGANGHYLGHPSPCVVNVHNNPNGHEEDTFPCRDEWIVATCITRRTTQRGTTRAESNKSRGPGSKQVGFEKS